MLMGQVGKRSTSLYLDLAVEDWVLSEDSQG